jgi:hypothetical protein
MVSNIYAEFYLVVQTVTKIKDKSVLKSILYGAKSISYVEIDRLRGRERTRPNELNFSWSQYSALQRNSDEKLRRKIEELLKEKW